MWLIYLGCWIVVALVTAGLIGWLMSGRGDDGYGDDY